MTTAKATCPTTPANLRIRRLREEDAGLLCEMVSELAEFEKLAHECRLTEESVLANLLGPNRAAEGLIAWIDEIPVGFAIYYRTFSSFTGKPGFWVEDLYIRQRYRERGIGRHMLREVARIAHCLGAGRLEWTTLQWNAQARRLYAAIGAEEKDNWLLLHMDPEAMAEFAGARGVHEGCRCGGSGAGHNDGSCNCNH